MEETIKRKSVPCTEYFLEELQQDCFLIGRRIHGAENLWCICQNISGKARGSKE